jgi:hypothetical protein
MPRKIIGFKLRNPPKPKPPHVAPKPEVPQPSAEDLQRAMWRKEVEDSHAPESPWKEPGLLDSIHHDPGSKEWSDVIVNRLTLMDD